MPDDTASAGPTEPDRAGRPAGLATQIAVGVAALAEAWLRDTVFVGVWLLSLGTVLAGFSVADGASWAAFGTVVGLLGAALPTVGLVRRWPVSRVWLSMLAVVVVDVAAIALMASA